MRRNTSTDGPVFDLPVLATSRWMFTCYSLLGSDGSVVLVDPGLPSTSEGALAAVVRADHRTQDVVALVATHGHVDHVAGMPTALDRTPAGTHLPRRCRDYLDGESPRDFGRDANIRYRVRRDGRLSTLRATPTTRSPTTTPTAPPCCRATP